MSRRIPSPVRVASLRAAFPPIVPAIIIMIGPNGIDRLMVIAVIMAMLIGAIVNMLSRRRERPEPSQP